MTIAAASRAYLYLPVERWAVCRRSHVEVIIIGRHNEGPVCHREGSRVLGHLDSASKTSRRESRSNNRCLLWNIKRAEGKTASLAVAANGGFPPRKTQKVFYVAEAKKALIAACSRLKLPNYSGRAFSENVHYHCNRAPGQIFFTDFGESSK